MPESVYVAQAHRLVELARAHPEQVRAGRDRIEELGDILGGHQPARIVQMNHRRTSRGHRRRDELSVDQALADAMSYLMPTPGSEVEEALLALRRAVLQYSDPAQEMTRQHQAPPPGPLT